MSRIRGEPFGRRRGNAQRGEGTAGSGCECVITKPPEAYERLIHDAMVGDQTLFIRADEVEAAWSVIDPIEQGWAESKKKPYEYVPGTWGPKEAQRLIEVDGRRWLHSNGALEPIIACSL